MKTLISATRSSPKSSDTSTSTAIRLAAGFGLAITVFLSGCRTPPDLRPFADATSQLAGSIKTTGRTVASEVDSMSAKWEADQRNRALDITGKFSREWTRRNALADALLEYSASLSAIAQAGEKGEESARAVAGSFQKLCNSIDVALPQATVVEGAVKVGSYLYGKYAQDKAARTLGESMRKLQPVIDETAVVLNHSLQQIETALDAVRAQNAQNIEDESLDGIKVRTERNTLKVLTQRRAALLNMLDAEARTRDGLRTQLLSSTNAAAEAEFARRASLAADITSELAAIEASLKTQSDRLAPIDARKAAEHDRLTLHITLVRTASAGLDDWSAAHSRLAAAALEKKPLQVDDLVQTALEIRDLIKTIRTSPKE